MTIRLRSVASAFLLLLLLLAHSAAAQTNPSATVFALRYEDVDNSGTTTCGDLINVVTTINAEVNQGDLEDLRITFPVPDGADLIASSTIANNPNDTPVYLSGRVPGDREVIVDFGHVCFSQAQCTSLGATLSFRLRIRDPNADHRLLLQGSVDGSNFPAFETTDVVAHPAIVPVEVPYEPCPGEPSDPGPGPNPPSLWASLDDRLVVDHDGDGLVDVGDVVRLTAQVQNTGGQYANAVVLAVDQPDYTDLVPGSVLTGTGGLVLTGNQPADSAVRIEFGPIPPSVVRTAQFDVVVEPVPSEIVLITSQGQITSSSAPTVVTDDPETAATPDPTITPLDFDPDLTIAKAPEQSPARPGQLLRWHLVWSNSSRAGARGVVVRETVPQNTYFHANDSDPRWSCADGASGGSVCTLALGNVIGGDSGPLTFSVVPLPSIPAGVTHLTNLATIEHDGAAGPDTDPTNNSVSSTVALAAAPDLVLRKTGPPSTRAGDLIVYGLALRNDGDQAAGGVEIIETVPASTSFVPESSADEWTCSGTGPGATCTLAVGPLGVGQKATADFAVRVADRLPPAVAFIENFAVADDDGTGGPDPTPGDRQATATTPIEPAGLSVAKSGPATARAGDVLSYTIQVANTGGRSASSVVLEEGVPRATTFVGSESDPRWSCLQAATGTTCELGIPALEPGGTETVTFSVRLASVIPAELFAVVNVVEVDDDASGDDPTLEDRSSEVTTTVDAVADLELQKTDAGQVALPGSTISYTVAITNVGDRVATGVVVTDILPDHTSGAEHLSTSGWSCASGSCSFPVGELRPGASRSLTLVAAVDPDLPLDVEQLTNRAVVDDDGSAGADPTPSNNSDEVTTPVERLPEPLAAIRATLLDDWTQDVNANGLIDAGDRITYFLTLVASDADVRDVVAALPFDDHTRLAPGLSTTTGGVLTEVVDEAGDEVRLELPQLAVGESVTLTAEVVIASELPPDLSELSAQARVRAANAPATVSDDPDTLETLDPTRTPLDAAGGPPAVDVPTVSEVGALLLVLLLAGLAVMRLRLPFLLPGA